MAIATWGGDDDRVRLLRELEREPSRGDIDHRFRCSPDVIEKEQKFPEPFDLCSECQKPRLQHRSVYAFGPAPLQWLLCYVMNEHLEELRARETWPP